MKFIFVFLFFPSILLCSSIKEFTLSTFEEFKKGKLDGLQITEKGLSLGLSFEKREKILEEGISFARETKERIIFSSIGTNKIYLFDNEIKEIGKIEEGVITSILEFKDKIYIGVSSPGKIYLLEKNEIKLLFELKEKKVLAMEEINGEVYFATGESGSLYKIKGEKLEEILKIKEEGISAIYKTKNGDIILGTYGKGLILKFDGKNSKILYNSELQQISQFSEDRENNLYFLASGFPKIDEKEKIQNIISIIGVCDKDGRFKKIKELKDIFVNAILFDERLNCLLYGGTDGKLYSLKDEKESLLYEFEQKEVSYIFKNFIITSNSCQIYKINKANAGVYLSEILDPKRSSKWGKIFWNGNGNVGISVRFGEKSEVDESWSEFTPTCKDRVCFFENTSSYAQIKVEIKEKGLLENLLWISKPINLPPKIKSFKVLKTGEVFLKGAPPADNIIIEATNPDKYGMFTTIDFPPPEGKEKGLKKAYKKGFITLTWEVYEPDNEEVEYFLDFQASGENKWFPVFKAEKITFFSFDTTALPDGFYKFRLTAYDLPEREKVEESSPLIYFDNTSPEIKFKKEKDLFLINVKDKSRLIKAEFSCDGTPFKILNPEDGILDGLEENFKLKSENCSFLVFRTMDSFYNTSTVSIK